MTLGIILASVSVFIWGITFVCTKSLLLQFSPLEILFYRFLLAFLGLFLIRPKKLVLKNKKENWLFALAGLSGVVLYQFTENIAISYTTASNVSIIVAISPMFTAIISQIFQKEKHITPFFIIGFAVAIIGIALVSFNGNASLSINPLGDLLALCSSICWGFYSLFVSRINALGYDNICSTRRVFFFAILFMIPLMIAGGFFGQNIPAMHINLDPAVNAARFSSFLNWFNLAFLGLLASALCFAIWNIACNIVGTVRVSVGIYLIPVVTIVFAFFALGEQITLMGLSGAVLTIAGLFISNIKSK